MRTIVIEPFGEGRVGTIFKVKFIEEHGVCVGHWPIHAEGIEMLVVNWIEKGERPQ